ncbi:MAG: CPBP family intramembrane glutamic endopeptidase [Chloroflexota bacterium]
MAEGTAMRAAGWMMGAGTVTSFLGAILFLSVGSGRYPIASWQWPRSSIDLLLLAGSGGLALLGGLAALLGLTLYVLLPAFSRDGQALRSYGSHRVVLACTALAAVLGNLLAVLYFVAAFPLMALISGGGRAPELTTGRILSPEGIAVAAISLDVALLAIVYLRVVRPGAISWARMGLDSRGLIGRLLLGLMYGVVLFAVSGSVEYLLGQVGIRQTQGATFQSVPRASLQEFGLVLLVGAVVAPIVEEIFFRGYVFRAYQDQKGLLQAFVFSSGLFALVHLDLAALLPILTVGLLLAFLFYRTGSVLPGIVAHAANNAVAFTLLYLGVS